MKVIYMGKKIIVAGGGHGGIAAGALLAKNGFDVTVYEKCERKDIGYDWTDIFDKKAYLYYNIQNYFVYLDTSNQVDDIITLFEKKYDIDINENIDYIIKLPAIDESIIDIISIIPFQILALEESLYLGYNPDKPRNLAKSVTVE